MGELVDDVQHPVLPPVMGPILDKVVDAVKRRGAPKL
jgi:hypothetical protein